MFDNGNIVRIDIPQLKTIKIYVKVLFKYVHVKSCNVYQEIISIHLIKVSTLDFDITTSDIVLLFFVR